MGHMEPQAVTLARATHEAVPTISAEDGPLYVSRTKIFPKAVKGHFRRIKWGLLLVTLSIYYLTPFIRWDRGPGAPNQAVLVDLAHNRFYFFFIEIWPQEIYYFTGLLILAALGLFLMNAVAGRLWCGYLCPQTVWTDLFMAAERLIEGDHREQMKLKAGGWTTERFAKALLKHSFWLLIARWTGGAWVLYFADAPTLVHQLATYQAPPAAYIGILTLTCTTYLFAGFMREQICTHMCPWPRIQAALTDEHALNVMYRYDVGEPRMSAKKAATLRAAGKPAGDCVDCSLCAAVCPNGIDIRNGPQIDCIQCGLCIDACDSVMAKLGREDRLIAYDTQANIENRMAGLPTQTNIIRPRTIVYASIMALVGGVMLTALVSRKDMSLSVMHDRNPLFVRLSDGSIRNAYQVRISNKSLATRSFAIKLDGMPDGALAISDNADDSANPVVSVEPDQTREIRVLVTARGANARSSDDVTFRLAEVAGPGSAVAHDTFKVP